MHFELLLNKLSPEILQERLFVLPDRDAIMQDNMSVFHRILKAKGLIPDASNEAQPLAQPVQQNQEELIKMMHEMMENVKKLQNQIEEIKIMGQTHVFQEQQQPSASKNTTFSFKQPDPPKQQEPIKEEFEATKNVASEY